MNFISDKLNLICFFVSKSALPHWDQTITKESPVWFWLDRSTRLVDAMLCDVTLLWTSCTNGRHGSGTLFRCRQNPQSILSWQIVFAGGYIHLAYWGNLYYRGEERTAEHQRHLNSNHPGGLKWSLNMAIKGSTIKKKDEPLRTQYQPRASC